MGVYREMVHQLLTYLGQSRCQWQRRSTKSIFWVIIMTVPCNSIELAQRLVQINTIAGNGGERPLLDFLAGLLGEASFSVTFDNYEKNGWSLCARLNPEARGPALCFAGHMDTLPLGEEDWQQDPFSGSVQDGFLYGRGACDMKSGLAAMVCAAINMAPHISGELVVQIYGGEERGCLGSFHLARRRPFLNNVQAIVVGEPTGAIPLVGHKGAIWLTLTAKGKEAHASMPEMGASALATMLPAAYRLLNYKPGGEHPYLGRGTCVLSTLHAGLNSSSVPDSASLTLDIRTVPGLDHKSICKDIATLAGPAISITKNLDIQPVWTDPTNPWIQQVLSSYAMITDHPAPIGALQYYTDAAALRAILPDVPVLIFGPGDGSQAHRANEACPTEQIVFMEQMYCNIIRDWYGKNGALKTSV